MYYTNIIKSISARGLFTLLALIISISLHAQNATVKGVIVDETDTPLIGATVQVKGTATGSITDFDGNYTIKANKGAVITFSYIGYKTQEIKFTGQSPLNVKMIPDNQTLDEVVVVGYGTMKRSDLTGSVASIAAKDVEGFKTSSVAGALGGQIAGVQITSTDGTPGAGFSINIRGVGTLTGDSSPLYIVDGFEVDDIDYLSNSDIESIEVLKDASSSAIYGARAAFGVILVTTKKAKKGDGFHVNYNNNFGFQSSINRPEQADGLEWMHAYLDGEFNAGKYYTGQDIKTWMNYLTEYRKNPGKFQTTGDGVYVDPETGLNYYLNEKDLYANMLDDYGFLQAHNVIEWWY